MALKMDNRARNKVLFRMRLGPAALDLDDLDELIELIRERGKSVRILVGERTADTAEDLLDAPPGDLSRITLISEDPVVAATLVPRHAEVGTGFEGEEGRLLAEDVAARIADRKVLLLRIHWRTVQALAAAFVGAVAGSVVCAVNGWDLAAYLYAACASTAVVALILRLANTRPQGVEILLRRRRDQRATRKDWVKQSGLVFLGAAATQLIQSLFDAFKPGQ